MLAVVAFLVLLNQILVQPPIMELTTDAPVINVAGRQRMLSQRLAKAALALDRASDEADRRRHRRGVEARAPALVRLAQRVAARRSRPVAARPE